MEVHRHSHSARKKNQIISGNLSCYSLLYSVVFGLKTCGSML